jgi:flagellin
MAARSTLSRHNRTEEITSEKLSSGNRVFRAAYDPTGLAMATKMTAHIRSTGQASRNINDSVSLMQVAEGALGVISELSTRLKELAIQAASDTITDTERGLADKEFQGVKTEIERLISSTKYNGSHVIKDTGSVYDLQIGPTSLKDVDVMKYDMQKVFGSLNNMGIENTNIRSKYGARAALDSANSVIEASGKSRADLGSTAARLGYAAQTLSIMNENTSSARSVIRDSDVALQTANKARNAIQKQATISMLDNANHNPEMILNLLK